MDGGEFLWGKRDCHPHQGVYGAWAVGAGAQGSALSCSDYYPNNARSWAVHGPFDLTTATSPALAFHYYGRSEWSNGCQYDALFVGSSTNVSQYTGWVYCGNWTNGTGDNGYTAGVLDLSARKGASQVWVAFEMFSDGSINDMGFTIDNVVLWTSGAPTPTHMATPTVIPEPGTVTAPRAGARPVIDGNLSEWQALDQTFLDRDTASTIAGGNTWSSLEEGQGFPDNVFPGYAVFYLDTDRGWGVRKWWGGRSGYPIFWEYTLQRTTDGGETWTDLWGSSGQGDWPYGPTYDVTGICAADRERVWAWGYAPVPGRLMGVSTDGGSSWKGQRTVETVPWSVRFDRTGLAFAFSESTLRYRNTEISAYHAYRPPQIDGNLADWASVPAYVLNAERAYRALWSTPTPLDASATLQAAWDAGHLYFALRVYDDAVKVDSGASPWLDDAVEIGLDGRHDHVRNWSLGDDRQFTVTALGQIYESGNLLTDVPVARVGTSNGYILEFAIPKAKLGELGLAVQALPPASTGQ